VDEVPKKQENQPPQIKTDPYVEGLFQKMKENNATIEPVTWELLTHILGNRVYIITLASGGFLANPKWVVKGVSFIHTVLERISGNKEKVYTVEARMQSISDNAKMITDFLKRLREVTQKKAGF